MVTARVKRGIVVGIAVAVLAGAAWRLGGFGDSRSGARPAPVPVVTADVVARDVPLYLTGIGTIQAFNTVTVRARVDGELVRVAFREGQQVRKGDVLAQIDDRPFRAALHTAEAALARDQATLLNAKRDLARIQDVAGRGYASRQQLDTQLSAVESLTAGVKVDEAAVENARVQLGYTTIVAPLDGRVGVRLIDQGNIVRAADPGGLVVVTQTRPVAAIFTLPQSALATVAAAQALRPLQVTAFSRDESVELGDGTLELIDNQIDPSTGTIRLKAYFPNEADGLWPGEFVSVRVQVGTRADGLTVPTQAVQRGAKGPFAYVVKADNTVEVRTLELGAEYRGEVLVTAGLRDGEKVVTDGHLRLQPGATVRSAETPAQQRAVAGPVRGRGVP
jgi:multidrug efflux system membrane fusion protein